MKYTVAEFRKNTRKILDSVDQGAEVLIQRYDQLYAIKPTVRGDSELPERHSVVNPKPLDLADPDNTILENGKVVKKNIRLAQPKNKKAVPAGISPVDSCPHGYAKGNCKKEDCNRKYRK